MSAKQQLVLTAERLFAQNGLEGVPLRQIGTAAGMANKSAVQYHFGGRDGLIRAILAYRVEDLTRRRVLLGARASDSDLRSVVEAHQLPLIELAEDENCFYLEFLEQLVRVVHPLGDLPQSHQDAERAYYDRVGLLLPDIPHPLRAIRIHQASAFCLHASAGRHRQLMLGSPVAPYAVHVSQLLDTLLATLESLPSPETLSALSQHP